MTGRGGEMGGARYFVEIRHHSDDENDPGFRRMGPFSNEREAFRVQRGANINLNHDRYYTAVIEEPAPRDGAREG